MYQCCIDDRDQNGYIILRPNLSESWQTTVLFFGFVGLVPLVIAVGFALLGFWPILPFAGLEVAVLAWAVARVRRLASQQEVIRFSDDTVALERGVHQAEFSWERHRAWIRAHYDRAAIYGHPHSLSLGYQDERCRFGGFLTNQERDAVVKELANIISVQRN
ncbi:MAG: DUF2244 domain-containing protein [Pseudomonadales bacterium]|nr:DUF2244 domain-containing protein [Pseudomonadales bacterium]